MKLENYIPDSTFINSFENLSNDCIEDILEEELIKDLQYKYSTNNVDQTIFIFFIRSYIYYNFLQPPSLHLQNELYMLIGIA